MGVLGLGAVFAKSVRKKGRNKSKTSSFLAAGAVKSNH